MLGERVEAKYSGSDTDSDTEEYCANAHMINPVTGHVEPPRKSPFEGKFLEVFLLRNKVEKILKGSLDSIPSPSTSVKIQIMGGKVCLRCKGKTLLDVVNKRLKTKIC